MKRWLAPQPGPLTLFWPVFRAPALHLQLNRCAGWPCSATPMRRKHVSSSSARGFGKLFSQANFTTLFSFKATCSIFYSLFQKHKKEASLYFLLEQRYLLPLHCAKRAKPRVWNKNLFLLFVNCYPLVFSFLFCFLTAPLPLRRLSGPVSDWNAILCHSNIIQITI